MRRSAPTKQVPGRLLLTDVELARPLVGILPTDAARQGAGAELRVFVRLHGRPVGLVALPLAPDRLDDAVLADAIWAELAPALRQHCLDDRLAPPSGLPKEGLPHPAEPPCSWRCALGVARPSATIVISTCGGPGSRLLETVDDALAQTYPCFDVVVVDNRPATSGVEAALQGRFPGEHRFRYVAEARPGLSRARNRGADVAGGEIVAFTDDDVVLDPDWLAWLVTGFEDPRVVCVTGLILPLEVESAAQRWLDEFAGYSKGFARKIWDSVEHRLDHPLYPYLVGAYGSGANSAFRRRALLGDLGGFDAALGAGTVARGGEDLDIYVRCIQRGHRIVYEPGAVVRHVHDRDTQVHRKVFDYGVGLGAMLTKHFCSERANAVALLARLPGGAAHLLRPTSPKNSSRSPSYPTSLKLTEFAGLLYAPVAYMRSAARERRARLAGAGLPIGHG